MAGSTNFPATGIDAMGDAASGDTISEDHVNNLRRAVEAVETKVGVDGSAVTASHDYRLENLNSYFGITLITAYSGQIFKVAQTSFLARAWFKFKCPYNPGTLQFHGYCISNSASYTTYARMTVTGLGSSSGGSGTTSTTGAWVDCGTLDCSSLTPGTTYELTIDVKSSSASGTATCRGVSIFWT